MFKFNWKSRVYDRTIGPQKLIAIHKSFKFGRNLSLGHGVVIEEGVVVGNDVYIGNYAYLKKGTRLGDKVFFGTHCRSGGNDTVGDGTTLKVGTVLSPDTKVGRQVFLGPYSMVLHQMPDGRHVPAVIEDRVWIGAKALVGPGVTIGTGAILGACSFAYKDCLNPGLYIGVPAKLKGEARVC